MILLRRINELTPTEHAALLVANLATLVDDLGSGAIVWLSPAHLRVRTLPMTHETDR